MLAITLTAETEERLAHVSAFRAKWSEALADTSDGLDPDPVFNHLEQKYSSLSERDLSALLEGQL